MNCGIFCLARYFDLIGFDGYTALGFMEERVTERGISIPDMAYVLERSGFTLTVWKDGRPFTEGPYIMYDQKREHFLLVEEVRRHFVVIWDSNYGKVRVFRILFGLIWSEYFITLCYNIGSQEISRWQ